jgi:hypothetical protein
MANDTVPRNEPETMRAKGRAYVEKTNAAVRQLDGNNIYIAREIGEQAYAAFAMFYQFGFSAYGPDAMATLPPHRFTWFVEDNETDASQCVKCRDNDTGQVIAWPHWWG